MRWNRSSFRFHSSRMHRFKFFVASHAETTRNNSFRVGRDVLAGSRITSKWRLPAIALCASISIAFPVSAQDSRTDANDFLVGDIRVEGLQRIAEGTVFNYLPINIGDTLDVRRLGEAVKSLYATGFFRDVELRRDGAVLVVAVLERPTIESFEVKGKI